MFSSHNAVWTHFPVSGGCAPRPPPPHHCEASVPVRFLHSQLGVPPNCAPCPPTGYCPGGFRLWPKAGQWVSDDSAFLTRQCAFPSADRCTGWDATAGVVKCGVGYDPAAPGCGSCLPSYYSDPSGCIKCPTGSGVGSSATMTRLLVAAVTIAAVFLLTFTAVLLITRRAGGDSAATSVRNGIMRAVRMPPLCYCNYVTSAAVEATHIL